MRVKLVAILGLLAAAGLLTALMVAGCGRSAPAAEETEPGATAVLVQPVQRRELEDQVILTGTAQAQQDAEVNPELPGKVTRVHVQVGDRVRRGQALVQMDTDLASAQWAQASASVRSAQARAQQAQVGVRLTEESTLSGVRQAEQGVATARARLDQARAAHELTRQQVDNTIAQADTGVSSAEATLRDVRAGAREQELAQARAAVNAAEAGFRLAESDYRRAEQLHEAGAIAAQQLDRARTQYDVARQQLNQAQEALSLAQAGARSEQVRLAELQVESARQARQLAEAQREQVRIAARDVAAAEAGLRQAQESLHLAREQRRQVEATRQEAQAAQAMVGQARAGERMSRTSLNKLTVRAPFDGLVAARGVEPGMAAVGGTLLVRLVDVQPMRIQTQASELQVADLRVGMPGVVTVDGLPGRQFPGRITRISPAAEPGQRMYTVEIEVDNRQELVRPGMFCRVTITRATLPAALVAARDAVVEDGVQRLVYVVQDGQISIREVELGASTDGLVQLLNGVQEGDLLVCAGQSLLAEGQPVQPQVVEMTNGCEILGQVQGESRADDAAPALP